MCIDTIHGLLFYDFGQCLDVESGLVNGSIGIIKTISLTLKGAYLDVAFIIKSGIQLVRLTPVKEFYNCYFKMAFSNSFVICYKRAQNPGNDYKFNRGIRNFWFSQRLYVALSRVKSITTLNFSNLIIDHSGLLKD